MSLIKFSKSSSFHPVGSVIRCKRSCNQANNISSRFTNIQKKLERQKVGVKLAFINKPTDQDKRETGACMFFT